MQYDLIVVGGGAAGFFGAIQAAEMKPGMNVLILEKTNKILSKVKVSGGGRCNVTHHDYNPFSLARHYPRGEKALKNLFRIYHAEHVVRWFAAKGVALKAEQDGRMFPVTDSSETIIECFLEETRRFGIKIQTGCQVTSINPGLSGFEVIALNGTSYRTDKILIASGGSSNEQSYNWISVLMHSIAAPIPSLFTFNDSGKNFADLMGISVPAAEIRIEGTKFAQRGPVLITHWGLSGPAVIKLSAWAAQYLHSVNYNFNALVNWIGMGEEEVRASLLQWKSERTRQKVSTDSLLGLPQRLSRKLCEQAGVAESKTWSDLSMKNLNKVVELLIRTPFHIKGKTTFKEEFVTCGGVKLSDVDLTTMESKKVKNIYFAGEVLDIDGETGGFNFQSAWTTAFVAAKSIVSNVL
jgi:predicted Rossmann fold flavoprotein